MKNPDGLILLSASQLSTFKDCPRKWALDKIDLVPRPETNATAEGHLIHAQVENYFRTGEAPERPEGKALLAHLPARSDRLIPEKDFQFAWPGHPNVMMRGFIDLIDLDTMTVYDHKTAGDLGRAVKSVETLRLDAQSIMYGAAIRQIKPVAEINLQWTYVQREQPKTRAPKTQPVKQVQTLSDLEAGLEFWSPYVSQIVQILRRGDKSSEVQANRSACYMYGPCQYRDLCPDYAGTVKKPVEVQMSPELLARLASLSSGTVREEVIAPERMVPTDEIVKDPDVKTAHEMPLLDALRIDFGVAPAILPPDAQPETTPLDPPPPVAVEPEAPTKKPRGRPKKVETPVELPATNSELPPWATPEAEAAVRLEIERRKARESEDATAQFKATTPAVRAVIKAEVDAVIAAESTPAPTDFDLDAFVVSVISRASTAATNYETELEAARISVELMQVRLAKSTAGK